VSWKRLTPFIRRKASAERADQQLNEDEVPTPPPTKPSRKPIVAVNHPRITVVSGTRSRP
jgi:hypothetical protein